MVDIRTLEAILSDQRREMEHKKTLAFCHRPEETLVDLNSPLAQVVIGVRRSGKSTLCFNALNKSGKVFAYVNFDDERLDQLYGEDLNRILETLYKIYGDFHYLFIDEIQNIPEWYLFVNRLLRIGMHIVVSGSNAKLLSGELATHLTGRHKTIELYPFSFAEYCTYKHIDMVSRTTQAIATCREAFDLYLQSGGFPELLEIQDRRSYISNLVNSILKRDIEQRFGITYKATFEQLAQHLLNIVPAIVVETTLKRTFTIKSEHTVKNYISYLCQAFLLVEVHKYSFKSKVRVVEKKLYPIDVALMNERIDAFAPSNLGWRLEVVVFIELLRRYKTFGTDIYYYRDRSCECDFLVCRGNVVEKAIQVCYSLSDPKTRKRELNSLVLVAQKTGCKDLLLLTDYLYEDVTHKGFTIPIRPVYLFTTEHI